MSAQIPEAEINGALANLQNLSDDELKQLIEDDNVFENFVQNLAQVGVDLVLSFVWIVSLTMS